MRLLPGWPEWCGRVRAYLILTHLRFDAVATAHVPTHSIGAAIYALQAIHRATDSSDADAAVARERDWQYQHLLELGEK